jgi:hypothetical protein
MFVAADGFTVLTDTALGMPQPRSRATPVKAFNPFYGEERQHFPRLEEILRTSSPKHDDEEADESFHWSIDDIAHLVCWCLRGLCDVPESSRHR